MNAPAFSRRATGFTLVEVLVVIAIIAILASLLLPVLSSAKNKAKGAACLSNLRQWGQAVLLYGGDFDDQMPRDGMNVGGTYGTAGSTGNPTDTAAWFNLLPGYVSERPLSNYWTSPGTTSYQTNRATLPFPGSQGRFWHCPAARMSDSDLAILNGGGRYGFFSYVMNIDLKRDNVPPNFTAAMPFPDMPRLGGLLKPAATVVFFDTVFNTREEVVNASPQFNSVNPANRWRSFATRHNKSGGNIVFADGHAQFYKTYIITNGSAMSGTAIEKRNPEVIWNPAYRSANP